MPKRKKTAELELRAPVPSLRYWRRARGLSVDELRLALRERDCWISNPRIYQWESGDRVALIYARALAAILDTTIESLRALPPEEKVRA